MDRDRSVLSISPPHRPVRLRESTAVSHSVSGCHLGSHDADSVPGSKKHMYGFFSEPLASVEVCFWFSKLKCICYHKYAEPVCFEITEITNLNLCTAHLLQMYVFPLITVTSDLLYFVNPMICRQMESSGGEWC